MLAVWRAQPGRHAAPPAADPEPPPQERELVRRTPSTPGRELTVAALLAGSAGVFVGFVGALAPGAAPPGFGVTPGGGVALVAAPPVPARRVVGPAVGVGEARPGGG